MPATSVLSGDTVKGLLAVRLGDDTHPLSTLQLLDRSTFKVTRTLGKIGWVAGSGGTRVAWTDSQCETTCKLVTTDLSTGRQRVVPVAAGFYLAGAAFSPDGNRVAIAYYGRHPQQVGGAAAGFVDVVDLATGARHRVPGVATDIKQAADLSWTPDGRFLAISVGITDKDYRVVGLWPASGGAVQIVLPRVPGGYDGGALLAL
jgi:DNA-binding beta-propeller fold protein YncE